MYKYIRNLSLPKVFTAIYFAVYGSKNIWLSHWAIKYCMMFWISTGCYLSRKAETPICMWFDNLKNRVRRKAIDHYYFSRCRDILTKLASRDGRSDEQFWNTILDSLIKLIQRDWRWGLEDFSWQRDNVLNDWPRSIKFAQGRLLTSKTRVRIQFLQEELLSLARHGGMWLLT